MSLIYRGTLMLPVLKWLLGWLAGDVAGALAKAYQAKLDAQNEEQRMIADAVIEQLKAQVQAQANAKEIRLATAGFWEMRLITAVIAGCFSLHLLLVTLDTCFTLGWGIPKYPPPFDDWQGTILLSFFGVQVAGPTINRVDLLRTASIYEDTMPEKYQSLAELRNAWLGGAATTVIGAVIGRVMWHANEVRHARRRFFGKELLWEFPIAVGMAFIGDGLASWLHVGQPVSTGLVAALAYLGPRGTEALFNRWFGAKLSGE